MPQLIRSEVTLIQNKIYHRWSISSSKICYTYVSTRTSEKINFIWLMINCIFYLAVDKLHFWNPLLKKAFSCYRFSTLINSLALFASCCESNCQESFL